MANPEHLALLKEGVEAWNEWRQANLGIMPDLSEAYLQTAELSGVDLTEVRLFMAALSRANLSRANLSGAYLSEANLSGANLIEADLREADLCGADLYEANLGKADLRKANLSGANLIEADLREADLSGAILGRASLSKTNLFEANLSGANLIEAVLREADLRGADLREANLVMTILDGVKLEGAILSDVILWDTIFSDVNLAKVKGLDTCHHRRPSTLDFRTLQQSGSLPLAFLRGCGLPDVLIDYLPFLLNQPIQYYSCFISYSSKDEDFAQCLYADLQNKGVRCWFAPENIKGGRKVHEQIGEAIQLHEKLLLVLSEHSMNSQWVKTEIAKARQREVREKRQVLFPIRLVDFKAIQDWECFDDDTGKDSAREVREYFIRDFSNWKSHDAYQQAFEHLLQDLKPALQRKPETT